MLMQMQVQSASLTLGCYNHELETALLDWCRALN